MSLESLSHFQIRRNVLLVNRSQQRCFLAAPSSPLRKQPSKESINSQPRSVGSAAGVLPEEPAAPEEELIVNTSAPSSLAGSPHLIHRNVSVTSSLGEAKLGRIQLTLRYSVQRQKFVVVVHKIAWVSTRCPLPLSRDEFDRLSRPYIYVFCIAVTCRCRRTIRTTYRTRTWSSTCCRIGTKRRSARLP